MRKRVAEIGGAAALQFQAHAAEALFYALYNDPVLILEPSQFLYTNQQWNTRLCCKPLHRLPYSDLHKSGLQLQMIELCT